VHLRIYPWKLILRLKVYQLRPVATAKSLSAWSSIATVLPLAWVVGQIAIA
jgi:hypothetical protein